MNSLIEICEVPSLVRAYHSKTGFTVAFRRVCFSFPVLSALCFVSSSYCPVFFLGTPTTWFPDHWYPGCEDFEPISCFELWIFLLLFTLTWLPWLWISHVSWVNICVYFDCCLITKWCPQPDYDFLWLSVSLF